MSASSVPASKMLNSFIKDAIAPALLSAGFKATGRVYRRRLADALQVVDLQNWKYNDSKRARFTIELGVCFPRLLGAVSALDAYAFYTDMLDRPGITGCNVRRRLGELMDPPTDIWWTVSATTGFVPAPDQVTTPLLAVGLPWMDSMSTLDAVVLDRARNHALDNQVMNLAALFAVGQTSAARDAASEFAKARHPGRPDLQDSLLAQLLSLQSLSLPSASDA